MRAKLCNMLLVCFILVIVSFSSSNYFETKNTMASNENNNLSSINSSEDEMLDIDLDELVNSCNESIIKINDYLKSKNTSILKIWTEKVLKYKKELLNFSLDDKNELDYIELKNRVNNAIDTLSLIKDLIIDDKINLKRNVELTLISDSSATVSLLGLYAAAIGYFNAKGFVLSEELLEHMRSNDSVNSSYKPKNYEVLESTSGYKEICSSSELTGSYTFALDGSKEGNDAHYSLNKANYNKTNDNSGIVISDRYDYEFDLDYDEFLTNSMCDAMYLLSIYGFLTPYYVILEYSETFSKTTYKYDSVYMGVLTKYTEKTGILGKWETYRYEYSVYNTGYYTIQTYGPDDTILRVFDENNNMLTFDDDSGYNTNGLICYKFESGKKYSISVKFKDFNAVGNIRIGFASLNVSSYGDITKINNYNDITINSEKYYANAFLLSDNQKKSFTITTNKKGNSYIDTYLYLIDPRRSNYYDGLLSDEYHPLYIYNDDGGTNRQALLNVNYEEFFSQNVNFLLISSTYNLSISGSYYLSIDGLDIKGGLII